MKYLLILIMLLISTTYAKNNQINLILGGMAYHYFDLEAPNGKRASEYYNNHIFDKKAVSTPTLGFRFNTIYNRNTYIAFELFGAKDCLGLDTIGSGFAWGKNYKYLEIGVVGGAYFHQKEKWDNKGLENIVALAITKEYGVIPIIGLEINPILYRSKTWIIKFNTIFTPIMSVHRLSFGMNF